MKSNILLIALSGLASLTPLLAANPPKAIQPIATWTGSVDELAEIPKAAVVITNAKDFDKQWTALKAKGDAPEVDFKTSCVTLELTRGSRLNVSGRLDESGDLRTMGMATRDLRPGFRYVLAQFGLDGLKSVNGIVLTASPAADKAPTLTGSVTCKAGGKIPEGATIKVSLNDISLADAASKNIATQTLQGPAEFPLAYALSFDPTKLRLEHSHFYGLSVRIEKDGKLLFINDTHIPVSKDGKLRQEPAIPVIPIRR